MIKDGNEYTQSYLLDRIHGHGTLPRGNLIIIFRSLVSFWSHCHQLQFNLEWQLPDRVFMVTAYSEMRCKNQFVKVWNTIYFHAMPYKLAMDGNCCITIYCSDILCISHSLWLRIIGIVITHMQKCLIQVTPVINLNKYSTNKVEQNKLRFWLQVIIIILYILYIGLWCGSLLKCKYSLGVLLQFIAIDDLGARRLTTFYISWPKKVHHLAQVSWTSHDLKIRC